MGPISAARYHVALRSRRHFRNAFAFCLSVRGFVSMGHLAQKNAEPLLAATPSASKAAKPSHSNVRPSACRPNSICAYRLLAPTRHNHTFRISVEKARAVRDAAK
jgi:hypothetical protein